MDGSWRIIFSLGKLKGLLPDENFNSPVRYLQPLSDKLTTVIVPIALIHSDLVGVAIALALAVVVRCHSW